MSIRLEKSQSSYQTFQRWMTGGPVPAKLLVDTPDGEKTVVVDATQPRVWSKLIHSLIAMQAIAIEAQNAQGEVLRRIEITPQDEEDDEDDEVVKGVTLPMPASEDARMLSLFAQLLANAYKDGAKSQRESSDAAFKMLVGLAESAFKRLDTVERALMRARSGAPASDDAPAPAGGADLMALVAQFMQGAQMAQAAKAQHVNGAVQAPPVDEEPEEEEETESEAG